ncbi:hypothetical protein K491DRAFT_772515 [Lophiostoma macrostomum CBS 122681]|uniref:Zn(2)-C6 fungal-type domain-containing protein n=1 Tax=Lophiostoma macrostomum CBS 122681 TaxID=1314788 RepID=A0A6A6SIC7_9PLEO|nr:hypothetical protein K491DRAFT_772515 [Lophiostoma macrostomum CBS 122681]
MSAPLRPLLPVVAGGEGSKGAVSAENRRKRVSSACEACRLQKTKCSGERPTCQACILRQTICTYTATEARQIRQRYEDLRRHHSAHEELFDLIKTLPEQQAVEVFHRVRAGADANAIVNNVKDGNLLLQLHLVPETRFRYELLYSRDMLASLALEAAATEAGHRSHSNNSASSGYQSQYVRPYHAAVFVEPRLDNARPSEWTTVSKDDTLMRNLLAAYFTHEYHLWPVFQKDYFLEAMTQASTGKRRNACCSPLLVNATLTYAYYCSKQVPNRFRYWEPDNLGYRFFAEAKRLWEMQVINDKHHNLASVQAALMINIVYNLYGLDKIGSRYGVEGLVIAKNLRLFDGNAHIRSERIRNARNFTAWCLFNIDSHLAWQFFRHPYLSKPPDFVLPEPSTNMVWYSEIWTRYPMSQTLSPTYFAQYFKATSDCRVILARLCYASFGEGMKLPSHQAIVFAKQLIGCLDYQIILMTLCQPFVQEGWEHDCSPRNIVSDAERDINVLIRLYYFRHGFADAHVYLTAPLSKLGFMSLNSINDRMTRQELEYARSSLLLALRGLREQGRNYYATRTIYYILKSQLRPEEERLLQGSEDLATASDEKPSLDSDIQSAWTPRIVDISDDPVAEELSKLAKQFLTIDSGEHSDYDTGSNSPASARAV